MEEYYDYIRNITVYVSEYPACFGEKYMEKRYVHVCNKCGFKNQCFLENEGKYF